MGDLFQRSTERSKPKALSAGRIVFAIALLPILGFILWRFVPGDNAVVRQASMRPGDERCLGLACQSSLLAPALAPSPSPTRQPTPCPYCNADPESWRVQTQVAPPEIGGRSAAVIEGSCGALILGINERERLPPASLTKMVTAMVVRQHANLDERVDVAINGWELSAEDGSSIMGLEAGMNLSVLELLYGLLLPSGNDAALALAQHLGGTEAFARQMNGYVQALGLRDTHFVNPDGRDQAEHYSSAFDMALLGRLMMEDELLRQIVSTVSYMPQWSGPLLWNNNYLLQFYDGALGVKTGYTDAAKFSIVAAAERDGRVLYASVLGSWNLYGDASRLLDWAFANTRPTCSSTG